MGSSYIKIKKDLLAFVHIEKAAGTTLTHILRTNFFIRHCDIKPLSRTSERIFQTEDLRKVMKINPAIKCISGHSIRPFVNLCDIAPRIRYITLLRDPVQRYISHYQHWIERLGKKLTFEEFMNIKNMSNFQTKKIAGCEDLKIAKDILRSRFFIAGIVEEFDEFLLILKRKLEPFNFRPWYQRKNLSKKESPIRISITQKLDEYWDKIVRTNQLDMQLYNYVKDKLIPEAKIQYGPDFKNDLRVFKKSKKNYSKPFLQHVDDVFKKCYYDPFFLVSES